MRITKKEAERIFNNGGTVYGYSKLATPEEVVLFAFKSYARIPIYEAV